MDIMQIKNEIEKLPSTNKERTYNYRVCLTDGIEKLECKLNIIPKRKVIEIEFNDVKHNVEKYCDQLELIIVKLLLFEFYSKENKKNINIMNYNIKVYCNGVEYDKKFVDMVEDCGTYSETEYTKLDKYDFKYNVLYNYINEVVKKIFSGENKYIMLLLNKESVYVSSEDDFRVRYLMKQKISCANIIRDYLRVRYCLSSIVHDDMSMILTWTEEFENRLEINRKISFAKVTLDVDGVKGQFIIRFYNEMKKSWLIKELGKSDIYNHVNISSVGYDSVVKIEPTNTSYFIELALTKSKVIRKIDIVDLEKYIERIEFYVDTSYIKYLESFIYRENISIVLGIHPREGI